MNTYEFCGYTLTQSNTIKECYIAQSEGNAPFFYKIMLESCEDNTWSASAGIGAHVFHSWNEPVMSMFWTTPEGALSALHANVKAYSEAQKALFARFE